MLRLSLMERAIDPRLTVPTNCQVPTAALKEDAPKVLPSTMLLSLRFHVRVQHWLAKKTA